MDGYAPVEPAQKVGGGRRADSKTVPSERTYWTDDNGYLVGKNKGGPGQT
ncbi:hypothetical protein [Streptomyces sp. NPDC051662]